MYCIGVAYILSEEAGITNLHLIEGCLLHDTVEDTAVTVEGIQINFGNFVSDLVAEVTDDKALPKQERKNLQVRTFPNTHHLFVNRTVLLHHEVSVAMFVAIQV